MRSTGHSTIRSQLTSLVAACVLPVWLIAALLVFHAYQSKMNQVNRDMLQTARELTMAVDRELASVQSALLALATSPSFTNGDFEDVHRQTLELLRSYPGGDIIVADASGQQLVNSFRPFGTPLPKRNNPDAVRRIFQTGKPAVSNLFFGAVTRRPLIALDVPVSRDGKVLYDLSMTFSQETLASVLTRRALPEQWYGAILDGDKVIVARTRNSKSYVGRHATPELSRAMAKSKEGRSEIRNLKGVPVIATFSQSSVSGWAVMVGVPKGTIREEIYSWMGWAIGSAAVISLFGILLALGIARRIAGDIQSLVAPATAIGRGEELSSVGYQSVKEAGEVAEALVQASKLLMRQAKERDDAERRLSVTIDDLQKETTQRLQTLEELREKEQLLVKQSREAALGEMIGNIAHQWRQPLNSLGLLVQRPPLFYDLGDVDKAFLEENTKKSMEIIQHMSRTIDDFRNFFKPDKEKVRFRVRDEVTKTLSLVEGSFEGQHAAIEVVADCDPMVEGYPNEFSQVLLNILINARDAMAERAVAAPRVVITISSENGRAVVTIADNAGGIAEEVIDKIFDPYFTTKGPQRGTGVGLFMSKNIIEKNMGGLLTVRNVDGGAEFKIEV
jgi:C4-dicarboxylate-specific signal transduction histidine kinase